MEYPDYRYQKKRVKKLSSRHRAKVIGKSLCGRSIFAIYIGSNACPPLIAAGFHGSEYLTVSAALRFAEECEESAVIVPCVNPDGTEISLRGAQAAGGYEPFVSYALHGDYWQANARGVDINRNFNADWQNVKKRERQAGIFIPCASRYGGSRPESEPETIALTRLCRSHRFSRVLALHSQGREIYWDFGDCTPPDCRSLAESMGEVSGYKTAEPEPLAAGGGFKDWFIQAFRRCGFTVEIGLGKNPLPLGDFETEYPRIRALLQVFVNGG